MLLNLKQISKGIFVFRMVLCAVVCVICVILVFLNFRQNCVSFCKQNFR